MEESSSDACYRRALLEEDGDQEGSVWLERVHKEGSHLLLSPQQQVCQSNILREKERWKDDKGRT